MSSNHIPLYKTNLSKTSWSQCADGPARTPLSGNHYTSVELAMADVVLLFLSETQDGQLPVNFPKHDLESLASWLDRRIVDDDNQLLTFDLSGAYKAVEIFGYEADYDKFGPDMFSDVPRLDWDDGRVKQITIPVLKSLGISAYELKQWLPPAFHDKL